MGTFNILNGKSPDGNFKKSSVSVQYNLGAHNNEEFSGEDRRVCAALIL